MQPSFTTVDDIKIYDGTTNNSHAHYVERIKYLKALTHDQPLLFTPLQPSTLTAHGRMTNVNFDEKSTIDMLSKPTGAILMAGCNYGEMFNDRYVRPTAKISSGRGRKPKEKMRVKRKTQGNGRYFSSQITFLIEHPTTKVLYKIKLFRNGVFQVPGIRDPTMKDLVKPIQILRDYLAENFAENIQVSDFSAVMRNYKSSLINPLYHINLEKLEEIMWIEKVDVKYELFMNSMLRMYSDKHKEQIKELLGNYNPMGIAEITYNTDRCFCLIIKFYRPSIYDKDKKTTVKLLKKGKINFDGGNSQQEIEELYYWLHYIYCKYKDQLLFDISTIKNEYGPSDNEDNGYNSIYDEEIKSETTE